MTTRTASVGTNGKRGEISLKPWTKRQMSPSSGERLKELIKTMRQAENEANDLNGILFLSTNQIATYSSTLQSWTDIVLQARHD